MAFCSLCSDGRRRADDHVAQQQQQLPPLLFVPTVVWSFSSVQDHALTKKHSIQ